jgi:hypothetical protein
MEGCYRVRYARIASPDPCVRARPGALAGNRPGIIALRAPAMGALASDFFKSDLFVWFAGGLLVFGDLLIIAFHQYRSSVAAVMISLFGWILAPRGMVLMAAFRPIRARSHIYGRDISGAAHLRGPRRDWALSHLCGLARQVRLAIPKEQPESKVMILLVA